MSNLINLDDIAEGRKTTSGRQVVRPGTATARHGRVSSRRSSERSAPRDLVESGASTVAQNEAPSKASMLKAAVAPAAERKRVRAIDGYRGLAAVFVIFLHCLL